MENGTLSGISAGNILNGVGLAIVLGGLSGGLAAAGVLTPGWSCLLDGATSAVQSISHDLVDAYINNKNINWGQVAGNALISAGTSMLFSFVGFDYNGKEMNMMHNAKMTGKDVLTPKGVHPSVKKSALNDVNQYNKALDGLFGRALGGTSACTGANNLIVFMGKTVMNYAFGWDF